MEDSGELSTPVVIVGGGPVGLVLALYLDFYNVKCTLINTGAEARMHPKGNGQNARTMEHYRQLGFSDEVRQLGLPNDHPFDQGFFTRFSSHEIFRAPAPSWNERAQMRKEMPINDQYPEPMFHVNQMYVEKFLAEKAEASPNVDLRFGWEAQWFTQNETGVRVHAQRANGGEEATWTSKYAVACDGGRSSIRKTLGIGFVGDTQKTTEAWMAGLFYTIYLRIPELYPKYVGHRRAWMYWAINADPDTRGVLISLNGKDEFEMLVKPRNPIKGVDPDEIKKWIRQSIGADIEVTVLAYHNWNAGQATVAERYRAGRILLAGDAAHLFTPVGGFGMNTGIDDASNLAWKLAAVIHGWGGPKLIESYELERKPVGYRNTQAARKYSTKWHDPRIPPNLEVEGPEGEEARRQAATMTYISSNHFTKPEHQDCTGVQLGARYDASPLIVPDGEPPVDVFPDTYNEYFPSGVPGGRIPQIWLDEKRGIGGSLFDHLGKGFTLLRIAPCVLDTSGLKHAAEVRGVPFEVLDVAVPEARTLYERQLVLVRPDQYIAWRGDSMPQDCDALWSQVCGY